MRAGQDICISKGDKMNKMTKIKRKGQEEILGFVIIVVIVAVIFLVFLGISIRRTSPATQREGADVSQFLRSAMEFSSGCTVTYEPNYLNIGGLLKECYSDSTCRSGEDSCHALSKALEEIIESNWKMGADRPVKGYTFNATYSSEGSSKSVIFISKGECKTERIGGEELFPVYPGNIRSTLQICY